MATVQTVTITITTNATANQLNSRLDGVKANNPDDSLVCLRNFLADIIVGVLPDAQFEVVKAGGAGTVTFSYGLVVSATPTPTVSASPSPTPTVTPTHTITPTPTVTPSAP